MQGRSPLLAVCGTRPEAVKLFPLIRELRQRGQRVLVLATGQHQDLAPRMFAEMNIAPDIDLAEPSIAAGPDAFLGAQTPRIATALRHLRPAIVLVQGDTVSTLAGALAGAYAQVPVAHVEAGLRTNNLQEPHPEELHRRLIAPIASLHFAPTARSAANLRQESIDPEQIWVTGNTGIDALLASCARLDSSPALQQELQQRFAFLSDDGFLLTTIHRRENVGQRLHWILAELQRLAKTIDVPIVLPMHPNPAVRHPIQQQLGAIPGIHLIEPQEHLAMVWLMRRAQLLLTDSGGLQEEAPTLGLRTLVLRQATERPEAIEAGAAELLPPEEGDLVGRAQHLRLLPRMQPQYPFGDGHAAERIADRLLEWLGYRADETRLNAAVFG